MKRILSALFVVLMGSLLLRAQAQPARETPTVAARASGLQKQDGFLPYYWDAKRGEMLLELSPAAMEREFLYFTGLGSGIGSIEMFADRSSFGGSGVARFRRAGPRVLMTLQNYSFRAPAGSAELKHSVDLSFPTSVIAALPIEAEQDGTVLVNANPLLVRDAVDLLDQIRNPSRAVNGQVIRVPGAGGATWRLDEARSTMDLDHTKNFPLNTETEALLTFSTDSAGGRFGQMNQPEPRSITVREHQSFVALPEPGFQPRETDPRVGFFGVRFQDFSQSFDKPLAREFISHWRLVKKDPNAAVSEPVKPLVFYLDQAIPEPIRSAARQGALWWNQAFEQAGFKNAIRVEDLPEGADPMDIRYPTIQWTNRSGRGWSVGQSQEDPRTGEIIHSVVQLDSHRMRTVNNYWGALIPPARGAGMDDDQDIDLFAGLDNLDPNLSEEQVMAIRLALLTCHEMGHVLGLEHNFVASTYGRGSVMDYYAPRVKVRADGTADLSDAYMQGVGSYDRFVIEWGYSQGQAGAVDSAGHPSSAEHARLDAIVQKALKQGIFWGNYDDPRWNSYDDGADPVSWLRDTMPVRDALLAHYGPQLLKPGEPNSDLSSRFALVYLFHRYALGSAANVVGSAKIPPSLAGDGQTPIEVWPAASQRQALDLLMKALAPPELAISAKLWKALAPADNGERDPERFRSTAEYLFSPQDGARAVAEIVTEGLLEPQRMARLAAIHHQDPAALSPKEVVDALTHAGFEFGAKSQPAAYLEIKGVVLTEVTEALMRLAANDAATSEAQAAAWAGLEEVNHTLGAAPSSNPLWRRLQIELANFFRDPKNNVPRRRASGAPPGPPV